MPSGESDDLDGQVEADILEHNSRAWFQPPAEKYVLDRMLRRLPVRYQANDGIMLHR